MKLRFIIDLQNSDYQFPKAVNGLLFSRFLPDNIEDSIEINSVDSKVKFWFERRGFHDEHGFIVHNFSRQEIRNEIISRQGLIEGGPLFGEIELSGVFPFALLGSDCEDKTELLRLVKSISKQISKETQKVLDILRYNFGQYWIIDNVDWDSRQYNLGYYCKNILNLTVFDDSASKWLELKPNESMATLTLNSIIPLNTSEYITEQNWIKLKDLISTNHTPSFAQRQLVKAFMTLDTKDIVKAFIDSVTVLEIALDQYYKAISDKSDKIGKQLNRIRELGNREQLSIIFADRKEVLPKDLEDAIDAIEINNKIVHEGHKPINEEVSKVRALLKLNSLIINEPISYLVSHTTANTLGPPSKD